MAAIAPKIRTTIVFKSSQFIRLVGFLHQGIEELASKKGVHTPVTRSHSVPLIVTSFLGPPAAKQMLANATPISRRDASCTSGSSGDLEFYN